MLEDIINVPKDRCIVNSNVVFKNKPGMLVFLIRTNRKS